MSDQTRVQTAGPVDPNAPLAQKFYTVVSSLLGLVSLAATFNVVTTDQAASLQGVGAAAVGLVGAVGTAVAAFRTRKQLKNGTFDPPVEVEVPVPVPAPPLSPVEMVAGGVQGARELVDGVNASIGELKNILSTVPGLGGATPELSGALGDLLADFARREAS